MISFHKISKLCRLLKIKYPIIQAGMSGPSAIDLVAEVSNAEGIGILGADSFSSAQLRNSIRKIKTKTPFPSGINLLIPNKGTFQAKQYIQVQNLLNDIRKDIDIDTISAINKTIPITNDDEKIDDDIMKEKIEIILEEKVPLISFGLGDPTPFINTIYDSDNNTKIMTIVSTVDEALHVNIAKNGVDIIIAQGSEAGGHRSTLQTDESPPLVGTVSLIPQIVDTLSKEVYKDGESIPVIASGGITDGRGLAAAICLGASGVQ